MRRWRRPGVYGVFVLLFDFRDYCVSFRWDLGYEWRHLVCSSVARLFSYAWAVAGVGIDMDSCASIVYFASFCIMLACLGSRWGVAVLRNVVPSTGGRKQSGGTVAFFIYFLTTLTKLLFNLSVNMVTNTLPFVTSRFRVASRARR